MSAQEGVAYYFGGYWQHCMPNIEEISALNGAGFKIHSEAGKPKHGGTKYWFEGYGLKIVKDYNIDPCAEWTSFNEYEKSGEKPVKFFWRLTDIENSTRYHFPREAPQLEYKELTLWHILWSAKAVLQERSMAISRAMHALPEEFGNPR